MKKISILIVVAVMVFASLLTGCEKAPQPQVDLIDDNYRTFYQIFVGSFSDASNDGIGDIRGIINRFDYLNDGDISSGRDLGVQAIHTVGCGELHSAPDGGLLCGPALFESQIPVKTHQGGVR